MAKKPNTTAPKPGEDNGTSVETGTPIVRADAATRAQDGNILDSAKVTDVPQTSVPVDRMAGNAELKERERQAVEEHAEKYENREERLKAKEARIAEREEAEARRHPGFTQGALAQDSGAGMVAGGGQPAVQASPYKPRQRQEVGDNGEMFNVPFGSEPANRIRATPA